MGLGQNRHLNNSYININSYTVKLDKNSPNEQIQAQTEPEKIKTSSKFKPRIKPSEPPTSANVISFQPNLT